MRRALRANVPCALAAAAASGLVAWLALYGFAWSDYEAEAQPAVKALTAGHLLEFLQLAPAYGGSLVERAPFALIPGLWGGGQLAVYRMLALPALLAAVSLGVWLCAQMRGSRQPWLSRTLVLLVCVANPLTVSALEMGHAEELLGACMCVAALLLARAGRPSWAGVLLGLAIANKQWALLAIGPVLLALPTNTAGRVPLRRAFACLLGAAVASALVLAPLLLASAGRFATGARGAGIASGALFQPWQAWWFLGWHGPLRHDPFGIALPGYRTGPDWTSAVSHPLILLVGAAVATAVWWRRRRAGRAADGREALLALALVLLLRCQLDTWDIGYYMLPFLIALLVWEVLGESRHIPALTLGGVVVPWYVLQSISADGATPDLQSAFFLLWTLPLLLCLGAQLFAPHRIERLRRRLLLGAERLRPAAPGRAQETTVNSLGRPVSTS